LPLERPRAGRPRFRTDEFVFSSAGANRLARSLFVALRDHAVSLPDDEEVVSELCSVRMVETGPGLVKMSNPPGTHDDAATAIAMVIADLTERPGYGSASITVPTGRIDRAALLPTAARRGDATPGSRAALVMLRQRARTGPRPPSGAILGVPGGYDDPDRIDAVDHTHA
jgi:hypothetical protein